MFFVLLLPQMRHALSHNHSEEFCLHRQCGLFFNIREVAQQLNAILRVVNSNLVVRIASHIIA